MICHYCTGKRNQEIVSEVEFDITKHEFSNGSDISACIVDGGAMRLTYGRGTKCDQIFFRKSDTIAMAKALGVTAEDLL